MSLRIVIFISAVLILFASGCKTPLDTCPDGMNFGPGGVCQYPDGDTSIYPADKDPEPEEEANADGDVDNDGNTTPADGDETDQSDTTPPKKGDACGKMDGYSQDAKVSMPEGCPAGNGIIMGEFPQKPNKYSDLSFSEDVYGFPSVAADGTMYFPVIKGIMAISATGKELWTTEIGFTPLPPTIAKNGNLYVTSTNEYTGLYSLSPNGKIRWTHPEVSGPVILDSDDNIFVSGKTIKALSSTNEEKWTFEWTSEWWGAHSPLSMFGDKYLASIYGPHIFIIDKEAKRKSWLDMRSFEWPVDASVDIPDALETAQRSRIAMTDGGMIYCALNLYVGDGKRKNFLVAFTMFEGNEIKLNFKWMKELSTDGFYDMSIYSSLATDSESNVYAIEETSVTKFDSRGNEIFKIPFDEQIGKNKYNKVRNLYVDKNDKVILATGIGVFVYDSTGKEIWKFPFLNSLGASFGNDGTLYVVKDNYFVHDTSQIVTVGAYKDCKPNCNDKKCGFDGCGSTCGSCDSGKFCHAGTCKEEGLACFQNGNLQEGAYSPIEGYCQSMQGLSPYNGNSQVVQLESFTDSEQNTQLLSPAIDKSGNTYSSYHGRITKRDKDGNHLWDYNHVQNDQTLIRPVIDSDGNLFIVTKSANLIKIDSKGEKKWQIEIRSTDISKAFMLLDATGNIIIAVNNRIYVFDKEGTKLYDYYTEDYVKGMAFQKNGNIAYVTDEDIVQFDQGNEKKIDDLNVIYDGASKYMNSISIAPDGTIFTSYVKGQVRGIASINPDDLTLNWTTDPGKPISPLAISANGNIAGVFLTDEYDINVVSTNKQGSIDWKYTVLNVDKDKSIPMQPRPSIGADGTIYVAIKELSTVLYAFNPDLSLKWLVSMKALDGPVIGANNSVYIAASLYDVYADDEYKDEHIYELIKISE